MTGESPTVDIQNTTQQRVIDHEVIDTLPTGRSDRALGALIPGVTGGQDSGGALTAATGIQIHGSTGGTIMQSGVAITSGFGDSSNSQAVPNMVAFEEVTYDTAAGSAEMATGGVRIISRRRTAAIRSMAPGLAALPTTGCRATTTRRN